MLVHGRTWQSEPVDAVRCLDYPGKRSLNPLALSAAVGAACLLCPFMGGLGGESSSLWGIGFFTTDILTLRNESRLPSRSRRCLSTLPYQGGSCWADSGRTRTGFLSSAEIGRDPLLHAVLPPALRLQTMSVHYTQLRVD
jgi:hypothetical protein